MAVVVAGVTGVDAERTDEAAAAAAPVFGTAAGVDISVIKEKEKSGMFTAG